MTDNKSEFINVNAILADYRKHWWWFAISAVVCVALGYMYTRVHNDSFNVRANVLITDDNSSSVTSMSGLGDIFGGGNDVEDEVFIIVSHTLFRQAAKDLGINQTHICRRGFLRSEMAYPEFPVAVYPAPGIVDTLMTTVTFKTKVKPDGTADVKVYNRGKKIDAVDDVKLPAAIKTRFGTFTVDRTASCPKDETVKSTISVSGYDVAAENLAEDITSDKASRNSNLVELTLKTTNTDYGKDVLNKLVELYNRQSVDVTVEQGRKTLEFIENRLASLSGDLQEAESDIQQYKEQKGVVDVGAEASYNMSVRGQAEAALASAQTQSQIIKMTRDFIANPENAYELIPGSNEVGAASGAIGTYNSLIMRRMDLLRNARPNNLELKRVEEQIDAMRSSIDTSLERAYETSLVAVQNARDQANKAIGRLGSIPVQEREFLNLKRQQEVKQSLYIFLLQRREETAMLIANALPKARIVDEAYTESEPLGMGKKVILAIALLVGLLIPPALLYIKKMLRTRFETRDEVEDLTDIPVLGEICVNRSGESLVVRPGNTSSSAELFRMVRSGLQFILNDADDKVVLVTSTRSGEGKSYISLNLAASLSLLDKRVCLIGMDIRNPLLAEYLGLSNGMGVTVYLSRPDTRVDSLVNHVDGLPNLDVIVAGPVPPNPGELLASNRVEDLFAELRARYDYIIIDSAPVGMVSDTFSLARVSDATVYVCRAKYTTLKDLAFASRVHTEKRLRKMSIIVNGTRTSSGYGYGYVQDHRK